MPIPVRTPRPSADATRERILAAAPDLFSERSFAGARPPHGTLPAALSLFPGRSFDGASTREIAARAGVTQPLLNYHFSSKDDLWQAAVDGLFARLAEALTARAEGLRGVDDLIAAKLLVREFVAFSAA